ncbi:MAG: YifB family Mg chelatase-like AAA ATPase [Candidatus Limnocylindrales bacterium]
MLATLITAVVDGLEGALVRVEVDVAPGLPVCQIVGLPDKALSEARERVRGAIRNSGYTYPQQRITVNLAPAGRRKHGAAYDVAIAVGILVASGQVAASGGDWALLGELSLSGAVQPVAGVLPMAHTLARAGARRIGVPAANAAEAGLVDGIAVQPLDGLDDAVRLVAGPRGRRAARAARRSPVAVSGMLGESPAAAAPLIGGQPPVDLADVRGQAAARWALEVALAGGHSLILVGSPGVGKTLLARAIPGLLPPLDGREALEVTVIASVAGLLGPGAGLCRERPFRAPHHTSSYAALVGGGPRLAPGEVSLAHTGVLFLDELAEFDRDVLDALRQPLEEGSVTIARAQGAVRFPAEVQLVAAMNPCRCGFHGDLERACTCAPGDPERYVRRVSGPLLDRLDLRVEMPRVRPAELLLGADPEPSRVVAARIAVARARALARNGGRLNARLAGPRAIEVCGLSATARELLAFVGSRRSLTARGVHRIVRIARTIADLAGRERVTDEDLLAAADLRDPAAGVQPELAA